MLRQIIAPNPSPMTLDGTRTFVVGRERVAVIDPGPDDSAHTAAIAEAVGAAEATVLLTHMHPDHAAGAAALASRLGCAVRSIAAGTLRGCDVCETDAGVLIALHLPGHTPDHTCFRWVIDDGDAPAEPDRPLARAGRSRSQVAGRAGGIAHRRRADDRAGGAVFCGDLMMGGLDTTLVASPEGDLGDYVDSLARLRALRPRVIYPAHGPPFTDPDSAIDRYIEHRREREARVLQALEARPLAEDMLVDAVYGAEVGPALRNAARGAMRAYLDHMYERGLVLRLPNGEWSIRGRGKGTTMAGA